MTLTTIREINEAFDNFLNEKEMTPAMNNSDLSA